MMMSRVNKCLPVIGILSVIAGRALADPLPGEILKFYQTPLNSGVLVLPPGAIAPLPPQVPAPFPGHDEVSMATFNPQTQSYQGQYMADDFSDNFSTPIVHVMWWGSYLNNLRAQGATKFLIAVETDVAATAPGNTLGYSHPGTVLSSQIVTLGPLFPGSGTYTETMIPPGGGPDGTLYQYNAELAIPAPETAGVVEWLKIVALKDNPTEQWTWGWHNRDYGIFDPLASPVPVPGEFPFATGLPAPVTGWHFQDDAVTGSVTVVPSPIGPGATVIQPTYFPTFYLPAPDGISFSKDLAFALYTRIPEPASVALMALGMVGLARWIRRRH